MKKRVSELKDKATRLAQDTAKTAGVLKDVVQTGIGVSKGIAGKASKVINREKISEGLDAASKGVEIAAKGAATAAKSMEKASQGIKSLGQKLKKK